MTNRRPGSTDAVRRPGAAAAVWGGPWHQRTAYRAWMGLHFYLWGSWLPSAPRGLVRAHVAQTNRGVHAIH